MLSHSPPATQYPCGFSDRAGGGLNPSHSVPRLALGSGRGGRSEEAATGRPTGFFGGAFVHYAISRRIDTPLASAGLRSAVQGRRPPVGCIPHSLAGDGTFADVATRLPRFIEEGYNAKRLHSAPGCRPPNEFETQLAQQAAWF